MYEARDSYSQHGEDRFLLGILPADVPRFMVDVGANDGYSWSNSALFGQLGYALLLIEPMPRYADLCRRLYRKRKAVRVEQIAIAAAAGEATFYVNRDEQADLLAMRSSLDLDMIPGGKVERITVQTSPLAVVLRRNKWPRRYAVLSIDAEGRDLEVIMTAELETYRPFAICLEEEALGNQVADYLASCGYKRIEVLGPNGIYIEA